MPSSQCSCTLRHKMCTRLLLHSPYCTSYGLAMYAVSSSSTLFNLYYCTFCGIAIHAALSTPFLSTFFHSGHSLHLCPFSSHLKHSTLLTSSCLLIVLFSNPHCITLLLNTSNLFLGTTFSFFFPPLFLQFQARCPNLLYLLHSFPLLFSSSSLSLVRACFSLSRLLINKWYCSWDIVMMFQDRYGVNSLISLVTTMSVGTQDLYPTRHLLSYWLLP